MKIMILLLTLLVMSCATEPNDTTSDAIQSEAISNPETVCQGGYTCNPWTCIPLAGGDLSCEHTWFSDWSCQESCGDNAFCPTTGAQYDRCRFNQCTPPPPDETYGECMAGCMNNLHITCQILTSPL